jgi:hypothetical protein
MRKSIVLVSLVSIVCALLSGCMPNMGARAPAQLEPREYAPNQGPMQVLHLS